MARLAVAAGIAGVLTAGAAPAFADSSINYYSGSASGRAVALQVNPNAVLDVNLKALHDAVAQLEATLPVAGVSDTLNNTVGSTLDNPTAPINVSIDAADAKGIAAKGTDLTGGAASSTAVAIDARSLDSELKLLNTALSTLPAGTVAALRSAIDPLIANDPTGALAVVVDKYLPTLSGGIADTLGSPTVNLFQGNSVTEKEFPATKTGNLTTVQAGGLLTPNSKLELQPFVSSALASGASASNTVDALSLVPTGQIGMTSASQIAQALGAIENALKATESAVSQTGSTLGVGSVTDTVTGTVYPVINGAVGTVTSTTNGLTPTALTTLNQVIDSISYLRDLLGGLDGLQLAQIVGNNGSNSTSDLARVGDHVTASGLGNVAHLDVVKLNSSLSTLLGAGELASVDGVKGTASVTLDGVHPAQQSANGSLVDIKVLDKSLTYYAGLAGQHVALDDILPAGTSCVVNIPGKSTCHGIQLLVPVTDALATVTDATSSLPTLVSLRFDRGIGVVDQSNSTQYGTASITELHVSATIGCSSVKPVADALAALRSVDLGLTLAACNIGIGKPASAAAAHTAGVRAADASGSALTDQPLVDLSLGVAAAQVNLTQGSQPTTSVPGVVPPKTGNDLLILSALAIAALAAGIGLQVRKARA